MIAEQEDLDKAKFGSPKRYYSRLSKLRKAMMIKRKGKAYVLSSFGTILYELVERVRIAVSVLSEH
jgi:predicted transcriptional regulator